MILTLTFWTSEIKLLLGVFQLRLCVGGKALAAMSAKSRQGTCSVLEPVPVVPKWRSSPEAGRSEGRAGLVSHILQSFIGVLWFQHDDVLLAFSLPAKCLPMYWATPFPCHKAGVWIVLEENSLGEVCFIVLCLKYLPLEFGTRFPTSHMWDTESCVAFVTGTCLDCRERWEQNSCLAEAGCFCLLWTGCPGLTPASNKAPGSLLLTHSLASPIREAIGGAEVKNLWLKKKLF